MTFALQTLSDKPYFGSVTSAENARDSIRMTEILLGGREQIETLACAAGDRQRQLAASLRRPYARRADRIRPGRAGADHHALSAHGRDGAGVDPRGDRAADGGGFRRDSPRPSSCGRGCPVVLGSFLSNTDMQSGSPGFGGPESATSLYCTGQLARHYGLPWRAGGGGLTSSQTVDAQAAYDALNTMLPAFLAGANLVMHSAGWLESGLVSCFEKFIVDIELLRVLREEFTPLRVDEESLAFDAHVEVGQGGHFLGCAHTLERFRTCFYRPLLSSTENFERWKREGGRDATARAGEIFQRTLDAYEEPALDDAVRAELAEYVTRRRAELGD